MIGKNGISKMVLRKTLPIINAQKYFLELTLDKPAPKFIKNDGEKGIEVIKTKWLYFKLSIIFINLLIFFLSTICFLKGLFKTFLTKQKVV